MAETEKRAHRPIAFYVLAELLLAGILFGACFLMKSAPFSVSFLEGGGYALASIFVTVLFAAVAAFYLLCRMNPYWFIAPFLTAAACVIVSRSFAGLALFFFGAILAVVLAACVRRRKSRLITATCGAAVVLVFLAAIAALCAYETIGSEGFARIGDYLSDARSEIHRFFADFSKEYEAILAEDSSAAQLAVLDLSEQTVDRLIGALVVSLPGIFAVLCLFFSYVSTFVLRLILKRARVLQALYPDGFYATPGIVSAVVFALCLILGALIGDSVSVAAFTVANLSAPMSFVFAMTGIGALCRRYSARRSPFFTSVLLILAFILWFGGAGIRTGAFPAFVASFALFVSGILYPVLYFLGLFSVVRQAFRKRRESR